MPQKSLANLNNILQLESGIDSARIGNWVQYSGERELARKSTKAGMGKQKLFVLKFQIFTNLIGFRVNFIIQPIAMSHSVIIICYHKLKTEN